MTASPVLLALALPLLALAPEAMAQTAAGPSQPSITQSINESVSVTLAGNTRPEAQNLANDRGIVPDSSDGARVSAITTAGGAAAGGTSANRSVARSEFVQLPPLAVRSRPHRSTAGGADGSPGGRGTPLPLRYCYVCSTYFHRALRRQRSGALGTANGAARFGAPGPHSRSGMRALALHENYQLRGVSMDEHGLVPEQLDRTFTETGAHVLYCMPTLQTPTASTMPVERRKEIVEIIKNHNAFLVEDDAYGFLCDPPIPPLSALLPERSFYIVSFAKCLVPGLRIGAMVIPPTFRDRCINALRSTGWMATPIIVEAVSRLIDGGQVEEQVQHKRETVARRHAMAKRILGDRISVNPGPPGFHIWLKIPAGRRTSSLIAQAAVAGVTIAAPDVLTSLDAMSNGVRLCLGTPETDDDVEFALMTVRDILDKAEAMSFV